MKTNIGYSKDFIKIVGQVYEDTVKKHGKGSRGFWDKFKDELNERTGKDLTKEAARSLWRYHYNKQAKKQKIKKAAFRDTMEGLTDLEDRILKRIKRKTELGALADFLNVTEDEILLAVTKLKLEGYSNVKIYKEAGKTFLQTIKKFKRLDNEFNKTELYKGKKEFSIAIISDTHMGSEYFAKEELERAYDIFAERGITEVYHAGDLTEGFKKSRVETFLGNTAIGFQDQLKYVVENYPKRDGITTHVISGNHDLWYLTEGLANIVATVASVRKDIVYLGDEFARVWLTPKTDLTLYHPNDGSALNVFTKLQRFVERAGDKLSKINILGHYHKLGWLYFQDVYALYPASFQRQSNWMNMNNLRSEIGCIILTLKVDDYGELKNLVVEHVFDFDK